MQIKKYLGVLDHIEGTKPPMFYLPVLSPTEKYAYELWPFFLAPFVVLWQIFSGCLKLIWRDLLDITRSLKELLKEKE